MLERCRRLAPGALGLALVIGTSYACEEDETRPGAALDCNEPACLDARGDSFPLPLPSGSGSSGAAGAAGGGGMPEPAAELSGTVREIASEDLVTVQSLRGEVEVRAPAAAGGDEVVVEPAADGTYHLEDIERGVGIWVGVGNFQTPPVEPFMDTLQTVDSTRSALTDLSVLRRDVLRDIAASSFLNQPVELSPEQAHLVLQFVDSERRPVEGVRITFPEPDNIATAYDAGDTYSDALSQTSTRGMAILLNLDAARWPGGPLGITADIDGDAVAAEVWIARGAVTIVTAVVPDP